MSQILSLAEIDGWRPEGEFYGVVGFPVKHSLSPPMQQAALDALGVAAKYHAFEVPPEELCAVLPVLATKGAKRINLTVPHKQVVLPALSKLSETAELVGAANTLTFLPDGGISGHNTDALGISRAIRDEFFMDLRGLRVLVLGAGGAARAVAVQCVLEEAEEVVIANRTVEKAAEIIALLKKMRHSDKLLGPQDPLRAVALDAEVLRVVLDHIDLVINCTSLGLTLGDSSPLPTRCFQPHHLVYDTIYRPARTPLMLAAERAGARTANGLSMLLHQGALSLETWLGREAPVAVMKSALQKAANA